MIAGSEGGTQVTEWERKWCCWLNCTASKTARIAFLRSFYKVTAIAATIVHVLREYDRNTGHWEDAQKDWIRGAQTNCKQKHEGSAAEQCCRGESGWFITASLHSCWHPHICSLERMGDLICKRGPQVGVTWAVRGPRARSLRPLFKIKKTRECQARSCNCPLFPTVPYSSASQHAFNAISEQKLRLAVYLTLPTVLMSEFPGGLYCNSN